MHLQPLGLLHYMCLALHSLCSVPSPERGERPPCCTGGIPPADNGGSGGAGAEPEAGQPPAAAGHPHAAPAGPRPLPADCRHRWRVLCQAVPRRGAAAQVRGVAGGYLVGDLDSDCYFSNILNFFDR